MCDVIADFWNGGCYYHVLLLTVGEVLLWLSTMWHSRSVVAQLGSVVDRDVTFVIMAFKKLA